MDRQLRDQITSIITDVNDMTIATVREDGFPQATTVSYLSEGLTVYFITPANSQKAQNIAKNNKVSLTINREYKSWNDIESLSMGALAVAVDDPAEREKIGTLLMEKFPQAVEYEMGDNLDLVFFRVEPKVISLLDYRKGFGHTELVSL
ncbi:pyridoxamine 5'-phosphate oxidase family protein [Exilibacterium tricleocarpae]|uniref:Pyridoxamine 5'-phosphate oxidase family protein n=1 Tax=Exilibacterium tricleocarpae TaxID=2591008 RepID=A0A545TVZ0_9GAMM|nr:pyridoxamine 5'-phosphate oxidase family protein [Exilibacterium tricleocarpae]TQV81364.1 pyridoxamine 5'-phosphate oxidase family protein [Exilibacterium tricleocarpae]